MILNVTFLGVSVVILLLKLAGVNPVKVPFSAVPIFILPESYIACPLKPASSQVKVGAVVPAC